MKVRIGKYPSRLTCNLHKNLMQRRYGFNWPTEQSRFENFIEKLDDFIQTLYTPINYFLDKRTQKVKVHIDRWDTWSMDYTLAHIVLPMLKQLKETKHGAPWVAVGDVPRELRPTEKEVLKYNKEGSTDPNFFKRWDWVIDEMIWAFEQKCLDNWEEQYYGEWIEDESKTFGGYHINADDEGRKAHQERMSNGFRLFGKYYENLWD
jgi:hypothetical protein